MLFHSGGGYAAAAALVERITREKGWLSIVKGTVENAAARVEEFRTSTTHPLPEQLRAMLSTEAARNTASKRLMRLAEGRQQIIDKEWLGLTPRAPRQPFMPPA